MSVRDKIIEIDKYVSEWYAELLKVHREAPEMLPDLLPVDPETAFKLYRDYANLRRKAFESVSGLGLATVALVALVASVTIIVGLIVYWDVKTRPLRTVGGILGNKDPAEREKLMKLASEIMAGTVSWGPLDYLQLGFAIYGGTSLLEKVINGKK